MFLVTMRDLTVDRLMKHIETAFYKQRMGYQEVIETYWGANGNAPQILPPPLLVLWSTLTFTDAALTRAYLLSFAIGD